MKGGPLRPILDSRLRGNDKRDKRCPPEVDRGLWGCPPEQIVVPSKGKVVERTSGGGHSPPYACYNDKQNGWPSSGHDRRPI